MKIKILMFLLIISIVIFGCKSSPKTDDASSLTDSSQSTVTDVPAVSTPTDIPDVTSRNTALLAEVQSARDAAITARADEACPDALAALDTMFESVKSEASANMTSPTATVKLEDLLLRYKALEQAAQAAYAKERVDGLEFAQYDRVNYAKGEAALALLNTADAEKDNAQLLLTNATVARDSYNAVLFAGFTVAADKARQSALSSKSKADSIKAGVAAQAAYGNAGAYFRTGDENISNKLPEAAVADFQTAHTTYEQIYEEVLARRNAAQTAIQKAEQKAQEVETFAVEADAIAPLDTTEAE
jgi:hypothetical protein